MATQSEGLTGRAREMAALVAKFERGGESAEEFARRQGMRPSTFAWWRSELKRRRRRQERERIELVEIGGKPADFELSLANGVRQRVPVGFDAAALARLLDVLCRC